MKDVPTMAREPDRVRRDLERHLLVLTGKEPDIATGRDWLAAATGLARELLASRWAQSQREQRTWRNKRIHYLSIEFLLGRLLTDTLRNLGMFDSCRVAFADAGLDLQEIAEHERDPALGNGGLGRLAACYLDSLSTLGIAATGYGLRFEYGLFNQQIDDGWQVEKPEHWLRHGNPWEFLRTDLALRVPFCGRVAAAPSGLARSARRWTETEDVIAVPYDMPVSGYRSDCVNTLRLWTARARKEFDLGVFHDGEHARAVAHRTQWESLTRVLYPSDQNEAGRRLRFMQQYFFVSASVQDILRAYLAAHLPLDRLPDKVAIAINDTHPALVVPELVRQLVDEHGLDLEHAWDITQRTVSYTNHTLMPEALESWPVRFFEDLLPRHIEIIYAINDRFLQMVRRCFPQDVDFVRRVSFVDEAGERRVRMAHVAFAGSRRINGVSELHTRLLRTRVFADLDRVLPNRILNVTNGVTPRRWLSQANPELAALITSRIGEGWLRDLDQLERIAAFADDAEFRHAFRGVKRANKERLARHAAQAVGIAVDPASMFDVHVKRIHEYKRQLLKLLHVVAMYHRLREGGAAALPARTVVFSGKAAPGYAMAKLIVKLIHDVADAVNRDLACAGRLRVLFLPNYGVSLAERIIPAADLSEQISTAGTEASGTGNMKLALNGALTIGTRDGANLEIARAVGGENCFVFGLAADEAARLRSNGYDPRATYLSDPELREAVDAIAQGRFSANEPDRFRPLVESLLEYDTFMVLADFPAYLGCQAEVEALYGDVEDWTRRAILNVARMGHLSSDRAIREYAERVWAVHGAERRAAAALEAVR